ncbi:hypothetical protein Pstr01_33170 [Pseudomonas straminea]|uniref:Uncharacterized protein n=1 Tax=Pseudomonas straminea TaxID=47882 RepID=A0A1I1WQ87_PSEOC|nr:hypothetical protein Pstr01_33170 [Pseudomonas straminea]SFD96558.1 hypothetical protein SAMN05216372_10669 [Pseudomonas straminea]
MYRPPSVRNFKLFIGELTSQAAAVHVSLFESQKLEHADDNYWTQKAAEAGIKLEGIASKKILNSQSRLSIVSIYSGFDLFLEEIESECKFFGFEWVKPEKVSPLEVLEKNFTKLPDNKTHFRYETDSINYFRILRNSIAHPSEENKVKAVEFFKSKKESIDFIRARYQMVSAPNEPNSVSFHDIKFWCQFLLDYTEKIASLLEPAQDMVYSKVPFEQWRKYGEDHEKLKRSARNYIRSQYCYSLDKAAEIVDKFYGPLA